VAQTHTGTGRELEYPVRLLSFELVLYIVIAHAWNAESAARALGVSVCKLRRICNGFHNNRFTKTEYVSIGKELGRDPAEVANWRYISCPGHVPNNLLLAAEIWSVYYVNKLVGSMVSAHREINSTVENDKKVLSVNLKIEMAKLKNDINVKELKEKGILQELKALGYSMSREKGTHRDRRKLSPINRQRAWYLMEDHIPEDVPRFNKVETWEDGIHAGIGGAMRVAGGILAVRQAAYRGRSCGPDGFEGHSDGLDDGYSFPPFIGGDDEEIV